MMKKLGFVLVVGVLVVGASVPQARADDAAKKAEAQQKIDEAKAKGCTGVQKYLQAQAKACPDEAAAAKPIVCSAAEYAKMQALNVSCSEKLKAKGAAAAAGAGKTAGSPTMAKTTPATTPAADAPPVAAGDKNSCKALDMADGSVIAQETTAKPGDCMKKLKETVTRLKCPAAKKFKYNFVRGGGKPMFQLVLCK